MKILFNFCALIGLTYLSEIIALITYVKGYLYQIESDQCRKFTKKNNYGQIKSQLLLSVIPG